MFEGFYPETIDFLWGIRMNNNREWFEAHKQEYVKYLYEPMKALGQELYEPFRGVPGMIMKCSRIYKDARMHPAVPYKETLWISLRRPVDSWSQHPTLCCEIRPEGVRYGFVLFRPSPANMEAFRREIAARPEEFLRLLARTEGDTGLPMQAGCYKKPKPCPVPELEPYYAWRGDIVCIADEPVGENLFSQDLADRVKHLLTALLPWNEFWQSLIG